MNYRLNTPNDGSEINLLALAPHYLLHGKSVLRRLLSHLAPAMRGPLSFSASWTGNVSPKSASELQNMGIRALVRFLKTWQPSPQESITEPAPSYQGLHAALKQ